MSTNADAPYAVVEEEAEPPPERPHEHAREEARRARRDDVGEEQWRVGREERHQRALGERKAVEDGWVLEVPDARRARHRMHQAAVHLVGEADLHDRAQRGAHAVEPDAERIGGAEDEQPPHEGVTGRRGPSGFHRI